MSLDTNSTAKRRLFSSSESEITVPKRPCEDIERAYGDTYATGNAFVHNGDNLHFHQGTSLFQNEVRQLQASFTFPGMHDRYENLRDAQIGTYDWILNQDPEGAEGARERSRPMATFFDWYENGAGTYWISGKPGSGKSTLMKYLVENIGSCKAVTQCPTLIVLYFFLWIGGEDLQRNKLGCLKSLLWQLLQNPTTQLMTVRSCRPYFKNAWSQQRLEAALLTTLGRLDGPVVLFIDGLDEGTGHEELLDLLHSFNAISQLKTCVSSRPEPVFIDKLNHLPSLRLHELNSYDIQRFIQKTLLQDSRIKAMKAKPSPWFTDSDIDELASKIEWKSEGVFLWVHLVVKDLLKGISNKDGMQTLLHRLERLPGDIIELYKDMLRRSQTDTSLYEEDVSLYLSLILHREFDLLDFCFAVDGSLRHNFLQASILDDPTMAMAQIDCDKVRVWIEARTAGLLEIQEYDVEASDKMFLQVAKNQDHVAQFSDLLKYRNCYVRVVHRTAHDFLRDTDEGNALLRPSRDMDSKIKEICFQVQLIRHLVLPSLLGFCVSVSESRGVFRCSACGDEEVYARFRVDGENVFRWLCQAGLLRPDKDFECSFSGSGSVYGTPFRTAPPFSSSRYAEIDLASVLVFAGCFRAAQLLLTERCSTKDERYMSMFLAPSIYFLVLMKHTYENEEAPGIEDFLDFIISQNAELHKAITAESEESLFAPGQTLDVTGPNDNKIVDVYSKIRFTPLCYDCHNIWFNSLPANVNCRTLDDPHVLLWGNYTTSPNIKNDRLFVMASTSSVPGDTPEMWAVSEADSDALGWSKSGMLPGRSEAPGVISIHQSNFGSKKVGRSEFKKLCRRSRNVSFADAMRHIGKSEKTIHTFYRKEAERMALEPEKTQAGWKEWFWGSDVPSTQNTGGGLVELPDLPDS